MIFIRLVFKNLTNVPSEAAVLNAATALLDSNIRLARDTETVRVYNPVSIQNVTYESESFPDYAVFKKIIFRFNDTLKFISFTFSLQNLATTRILLALDFRLAM